MTRKECETVLSVLEKIKNPDSYVTESIHIIKKNIAMFDSRKGQLIDNYEVDISPW